MLEQGNSSSASRRDGIGYAPDVVRVHHRASCLDGGGAHVQQSPCERTERPCLILGTVAVLDGFDFTALVPGNEQEINQTDDVVLTKMPKLGEYLTGELAVLEADHQYLNWTKFHWCASGI